MQEAHVHGRLKPTLTYDFVRRDSVVFASVSLASAPIMQEANVNERLILQKFNVTGWLKPMLTNDSSSLVLASVSLGSTPIMQKANVNG